MKSPRLILMALVLGLVFFLPCRAWLAELKDTGPEQAEPSSAELSAITGAFGYTLGQYLDISREEKVSESPYGLLTVMVSAAPCDTRFRYYFADLAPDLRVVQISGTAYYDDRELYQSNLRSVQAELEALYGPAKPYNNGLIIDQKGRSIFMYGRADDGEGEYSISVLYTDDELYGQVLEQAEKKKAERNSARP